METQSLALRAAAALGSPLREIRPLSGGSVSQVFRLYLTDGRKVVAKWDPMNNSPVLDIEASMLRYLGHNTRLPVPEVLHAEPDLLIMTHLEGASFFDDRAQIHAAELIAELHNLRGEAFGFSQHTLIGGLPQPNPTGERWIPFFRDHRLLYMAQEGHRAGRLPSAVRAQVEKFAAHLERWLLEPEYPSLIHGDLWTTNLLAREGRITGFLDPAIYFAHPEIELAFSTLFGTFDSIFYKHYSTLRPILHGFFEERRDIYNLYPLLVHVRLFGGSYVNAVERILARFGY